MAGETQNYHETRDPYFGSSNFTAVTVTTGQSIVPVLRVPATNLVFPAGYWLKPGRRWWIRLNGIIVSAATPGNWTFEVHWQSGAAPTDAGGTIICTSAAIAGAATKTASFVMNVVIESRGDPSTFVPTATPLFCYGDLITDGIIGFWTTGSNNPIVFPTATGGTTTNIDGTLAGTIHIDAKRSGSTAETITVTDLAVNAMTDARAVPDTRMDTVAVAASPIAYTERPCELDNRAQAGWIDIHLVRMPRRYRWARSLMVRPATLVVAVAFLPPAPRVTLQAVNRSSTF